MPNFNIKTTFNSKTKKNIKEITVLEKNVRAAIYVNLHNRYYVKSYNKKWLERPCIEIFAESNRQPAQMRRGE